MFVSKQKQGQKCYDKMLLIIFVKFCIKRYQYTFIIRPGGFGIKTLDCAEIVLVNYNFSVRVKQKVQLRISFPEQYCLFIRDQMCYQILSRKAAVI